MTTIIEGHFTKALNAAYVLYRNDRLVECQKAALDLLEDDAMPRYHRMKVLILLVSILGDWEEANQCREDAWALYNMVRRWHPAGNNLTVDEALDEVLVQLKEADSALEEDAPKEYAPEPWTLAEEREAEEWALGNAEAAAEIALQNAEAAAEIALQKAEDDIEATRGELEVLNMTEDDTANTKAELDVVKPTESGALAPPVFAKPRKVSRNKKFLKFDLAASHAERKDTEADDLPPEPRTPFGSISFADAARSGYAPPGGKMVKNHGISAGSGKIGSIIAQGAISPLRTRGATKTNANPWLNHVMQIFSAFMFAGIFTTLLIPETKRRTLEDLAQDWDMGDESITGAPVAHKNSDRGSDEEPKV